MHRRSDRPRAPSSRDRRAPSGFDACRPRRAQVRAPGSHTHALGSPVRLRTTSTRRCSATAPSEIRRPCRHECGSSHRRRDARGPFPLPSSTQRRGCSVRSRGRTDRPHALRGAAPRRVRRRPWGAGGRAQARARRARRPHARMQSACSRSGRRLSPARWPGTRAQSSASCARRVPASPVSVRVPPRASPVLRERGRACTRRRRARARAQARLRAAASNSHETAARRLSWSSRAGRGSDAATPHVLRLDVEREGEEVLRVEAAERIGVGTSSSRSTANSRIVSSIA